MASDGRASRPVLAGTCLALLGAGALISGFTILRGIDPFDEGLMLQAARRVAAGQVPYRDFLWAYGPAQPFLLAGLFKLFGVSLLQWRILRVAEDAAVALLVFLLIRRRAPAAVALGAWLAVAGEMAEPRSANPFPVALMCVLGAVGLATRRSGGRRELLATALLLGVAAAFRLDFALYGLAAVGAGRAARAGWRSAAVQVGAAAGLIALVYLPWAVIDGPGHLYTALIGNSLGTGGYWRLPFPLRFHPPGGAGVVKSAKHALDFYVPLLSVVGLAALAAAVLVRRRTTGRWPPLLVALVVLGGGFLTYLVSRADEFHSQPLFVVVAAGLAVLLGTALQHRGRGVRFAGILAGGILALLLAHSAWNRLSALVHPLPAASLRLPVADGVQTEPAEAVAIEQMVAAVDSHSPPGSAIYAAARRSDLIRINDPLIYVLTGRENPTPEDFGLLTGAAAQARIVGQLSRSHPRVIVRWTDPASDRREPNRRGRSTGIHTLDDWIAAHYHLIVRVRHYDVLLAD